MKDDKRMTTRNEKGEWMIELNEELKMVQHNLPEDEFIKVLFNLTAQRLCELEDKIENGTLVKLPCKVGDEAYMIQFADSTHNNDKIFKTRVNGIVLFPNGSFDIILPSKHFAAWGWSVFSTKDDAEKQIEIFKKAVKMVDGKKGITLPVAVNKIKGEKE